MSGAELLDCEPICEPFGLLAGQHEQRRRDGLPTVTTIVGHVALGQRLWKLWAAEHRRPVVVATGTSRQEWLVQWVAGLVNAARPLCGCRRVHRVTHVSRHEEVAASFARKNAARDRTHS